MGTDLHGLRQRGKGRRAAGRPVRGAGGRKRSDAVRQGGKLSRRRGRGGHRLRPEGGRGIVGGHQPGQAAERAADPDRRGPGQRVHEPGLRLRGLRL